MLSNQKIESKDSIIQLLLKQRTQKPVINAMMAADQEYRSSIKSAGWMPWH